MNYKKVYYQLIERAITRHLTRKDCYIEKHHIIPKAEGGVDDKSNLVNLTAREHYIAHLLLAKIYDDAAMYAAIILMRGQPKQINQKHVRFNSHLFENLRVEFGKKTSIEQKGKQAGNKNPMFGKSIFDFMSPEKIAQWKINSKNGGMKGKRHTKQTRLKMSITRSKSNSGKHWFTNGIKNVFVSKCPEGFRPGMIYRKHKYDTDTQTVESQKQAEV